MENILNKEQEQEKINIKILLNKLKKISDNSNNNEDILYNNGYKILENIIKIKNNDYGIYLVDIYELIFFNYLFILDQKLDYNNDYYYEIIDKSILDLLIKLLEKDTYNMNFYDFMENVYEYNDLNCGYQFLERREIKDEIMSYEDFDTLYEVYEKPILNYFNLITNNNYGK